VLREIQFLLLKSLLVDTLFMSHVSKIREYGYVQVSLIAKRKT